MATVPTSGTNIALYSGIPWCNDYKNSRWFESLSEQLNWFAGQTHVATISQSNFQRIEGRTFFRINQPIDQLWGVNYFSFQNADLQKVFYAFVTKLEYVQANATNVHFEIDVLQTWRFEMDFKPSFVAREHCRQFDDSGFPLTYTVDEGLNYGTEYNTVSVSHFQPYSDLYFLVTIAKKNMHNATNASTSGYVWSLNGLPQALCFYIHPFRLNGSVPASNLSLNQQIGDVIISMYESTDAVNNIVSMYVTNFLPDQPPYDGNTITFNTNYYQQATIGSLNTIFVDSVNYQTGVYDMGGKYNGFTPQTEVKLNCYPYRVTTLDDMKGHRIDIKNEYINSHNLVIDMKGSFGLSNKVTYGVKDYVTTITDDTFRDAISLENGLIDNNPNDIPVMVSSLAAFIQGNRNTLENQRNRIRFDGAMGGVSNIIGLGSSVATGNIGGVASSGVNLVKGAGDMQLKLQGLQAKQQDIANVPPSISQMGSNVYYDYGNGYTGLWILKKEITPEYQKKLTDYFNMYGYKLNEVKIPNFHTRQSWNYIQTVGCTIRASINDEDLNELKAIFDNGITLWHVDDIGNYTLGNSVIA